MNEELKAAMINARCATAMIRAMGMQAQNELCKRNNVDLPYGEYEFKKVIEEEGIHWNAIATVIHQ